MSAASDNFDQHLTDHQCGTTDTTSPFYMGGFQNCTIALPLFLQMTKDERDQMLERWHIKLRL